MKKVLLLLAFLSVSLSSFSQIAVIPDTVICPGNPVHLETILDEDLYYYYRWRPAYNLSDSTRPSPWVWPDTTTTYTLYAFRPDSTNLVTNGDFSAGNTGFISQYNYRAPSGRRTLWNEGTYTIAASGNAVHENFGSHYDHTVGTSAGQFLIVNGAMTSNIIVWSQVLPNVTPYTDYVFYAWCISMIAENPALLQFSINGVLVDAPFQLSGALTWDQFYTIWNSGSNTTATITIVAQFSDNKSGNDFGIDDIFFSPIYPDIDSVTITMEPPVFSYTVVEQCANSSYVFNGKSIIIESGTYIDTLKTIHGCDSITQLDIVFYPEVTVDLGENQILCTADTTFIILIPMDEYYSYKWNTGDTTPQLVVAESGVYSLTVTNEIGCSDSASVEITFVSPPDITISSNTDNFCEEYKMTLSAETDAPEVIWSTGMGTLDIEVTEFGIYYVTASDFPCVSKDTFEVAFCCPNEPYLPNVITPSDYNNINDYFEFSRQLPFEKIGLYIFDRWGKRILHTTSPEFKWGGTVNDKLVKGLYYYVLEFEDGCSFHGSITVL
ncbi:MAG: gliding motility-associated C-terminal domain-containing protein [Bacteroidales bacterium]|jgi:gliding motility-associated-like protein|nr:gliding motility-associated C-terminal domain-containing protein [Bacteroidales bacterium]